ncbi:pancreatic triacylglycerol lipase-like isoform X2 [Stegodyphus dumicola]|uniref:pancreatic triacylglycerol lipase-like isoform X2 n=1 Tax=Stegodyphus dumicola TaxID=202533 RepID=UPI0015AA57DA|nr:pancreatic triacylglycerol lipase-like isoform X2 [Stegodyphus dumicola]
MPKNFFFQKACITFVCLFEFSSLASRPPLQTEFPEKCYEEYGCFETGPPFHDNFHRPISLLPFNKEFLTTKFLLFTPLNPAVPQMIDSTLMSVTNSFFNPYIQTKIIIHGFNVSPTENNASYDITGNPPRNVHLIGHSLGAHLAGWTGKRIQGLGRITGLDPAGPYFYEAHPKARLDATDAEFVDVIHTNGGNNLLEGLGIAEAIGHVDFYLNGGMQQPGCYNKSLAYQAEEDFEVHSCSHSRAFVLFTASVRNKYCRFEGWPCESFQNFLDGNCYPGYSKRSLEMGLRSLKPPYVSRGQKYYLMTGMFYPYCWQ